MFTTFVPRACFARAVPPAALLHGRGVDDLDGMQGRARAAFVRAVGLPLGQLVAQTPADLVARRGEVPHELVALRVAAVVLEQAVAKQDVPARHATPAKRG